LLAVLGKSSILKRGVKNGDHVVLAFTNTMAQKSRESDVKWTRYRPKNN